MKNVDDVYPLSPMQGVMLFHALSATGADALVNQFAYELRGEVDLDALGRAWQALADAHPVLRTVFLWKDLKAPLQAVRKRVTVPVTHLDWTDRDPDAQHTALAELRAEDRRERLDPGRAPLLRVILVRVARDRAFMVWTSHHLILDRWCFTTVFEDLFAAYEAIRRGDPPPSRRGGRFRDYVAWLSSRDAADAESFWRDLVGDVDAPTTLAAPRDAASSPRRDGASSPPPDPPTVTPVSVPVSADTTGRLRELARGLGVTLSMLVQGAWALVLHEVTGRSDVVFGVVASGRPPELPGIETMLGSFINNLPVRVGVDPGAPMGEWVRGLQSRQQARLRFEHVALPAIQSWTRLPDGAALFDHLLVWLSPVAAPVPGGLTLTPLDASLTTAYPFALGVAEDADGLVVTGYHDGRRPLRAPVAVLLERLQAVLGAFAAADPGRALGTLDGVRVDASPVPEPRNGTRPRRVRPAVRMPAMSAAEPRAGREPLEAALATDLVLAEWEGVLGREGLGLDDDFFDLGGTSLLAATLHARIEAATRMSVPLLALFARPTVRGMSETIREKDWPLDPGLVTPIETRGEAPPLFCIASPEVNTIGYTLLARHLGGTRPVYVVQAPPGRDDVRRLDPGDLLDLAGPYRDAVDAVAPEGPIQLLGMCSGAHTAVELARLLGEAGRDVRFVGLVNTWAFYTRSRLYRLERVRLRMAYYARRATRVMRGGPGRSLGALRAALGGATGGTSASDRGGGAASPGRGRPLQARRNPWLDEVGWARPGLVVPRFDGTLTIYRIRRSQVGRVRDDAMGWGRFATGTDVEVLPGDDHHAILREPGVRELARRIGDALVEPVVETTA